MSRAPSKARQAMVLLSLMKMRSQDGTIFTSSTRLAKAIGVSQQTAVRYLQELEKSRLIKRLLTTKGEVVEIDERGLLLLREMHVLLSNFFSSAPAPGITFSGVLFTGVGEGAYYVSQKEYLEQFRSKLGFTPYPGTFNIRLTEQADQVRYLQMLVFPPTLILGFKAPDRTYGDVLCYNVSVEKKHAGAVVRSVRSLYDNSVVEIISPLNLRKELNAKDGDRISVHFTPPRLP
ncbi:MAG: CTP-dependent riboflavin kinase [Candidatus Brockarchaeota archaeon]|nr:CTP-dependent riboflavin kinase [Candidatus Brockarchaeota archaeon]